MRIKKLKKETYFKLMNYYLSKCDLLVLTRYNEMDSSEKNRIRNIIFDEHPYYRKQLLEKNNKQLIEKIIASYNQDKNIWDIINMDEHIKKFDLSLPEDEWRTKLVMESKINAALEIYIYIKNFDYILNKYKKYLIEKKEVLYDCRRRREYLQCFGKDVRISHINYTFKLSSDMVKWVLETANSIDDFCSPNNPDELQLFKDGYCKMAIIGHEFECHLYIDDENEYEDLKKMGIEFVDKELEIDEDKEWRSYSSFIQAQK